jgi:hypothetical protein
LYLPLEYLASKSLQALVVENANALVGELRISCFAELTMLISGTDIHPTLASKVIDLAISVRQDRAQQSTLGPDAAVIPVTILRQPFSNLKRFTWYATGTDGKYVLSVLKDNPKLEEFSIGFQDKLPAGLIPAVVLLGATLTTLRLLDNGLTDADLREIGQGCKQLKTLDLGLSGKKPPRAGLVTDAGIAALAESCTQLESVQITVYSVTGAWLAALFTYCVHLRVLNSPDVAMNEAAILALGNPARVSPLEELSCSWGVTTTNLSASDYARAFAGVRRLRLSVVMTISASSLGAALREMRYLQHASIEAWYFGSLPASVLSALAEGTTVLEYLFIAGNVTGKVESALMGIAQRNPKLVNVELEHSRLVVTDPVLHAFAEHCATLQQLKLSNAQSVTDTSVIALGRGCPRLCTLTLRRCVRLTDRGVIALAENCRSLSCVDIRDSARVSQAALELLLQLRTSLYLDVSAASLTADEALRLESDAVSRRVCITRTRVPVSAWLAARVASMASAVSGCWVAGAALSGGHSAVHPT